MSPAAGATTVEVRVAELFAGFGSDSAPETLPVVAEPTEPVAGEGAPPAKLDRAASELLRPMLRQWLAENMERILEDALRSELTDKSQGPKGPGKG